MYFRPHHVALTVQNMDETVAWYQDKLGGQVSSRYQSGKMEIAIIMIDQVRLEFFCFGQDTQPLPQERKELMSDLGVIGTKHLAIEVENIEEAIETLKNKDVEFATELATASFGGRYIFFKDCDGILIELYQPNI